MSKLIKHRVVAYRYPYERLCWQYRMHSMICDWISHRFYHSELYTEETEAMRVRQFKKLIDKLCDKAIESQHSTLEAKENFQAWYCHLYPSTMFHIHTSEEDKPLSGSQETCICNVHEAKAVIAWCKKLLLAGIQPSQIGIISPYNKQVHMMKEIIKQYRKEEEEEKDTITVIKRRNNMSRPPTSKLPVYPHQWCLPVAS